MFLLFFLSERIRQQFDLDLRSDALVEDVVDGIEDGHVDMTVAIDLLHTLRAEVALGNHLHLDLSGFDTVAFADHRSEGAVT